MTRKTADFSVAGGEESLKRRIGAMFSFLASVYGSESLVLKAGKLGALKEMKSQDVLQQIVALQKVVYEDPTIGVSFSIDEIPGILEDCQEEIAENIARHSVEQQIEDLVSKKMQEKHEEYLMDIKREILLENCDPETEHTQKKLKSLLKLEKRSLSRSALTILRPKSLKHIIGQDRAIEALLAKIASPYPQHVILYGPPGIGKTSAARLVIQESKKMPFSPFKRNSPFVETNGSTLRWDPRDITNPLLGSVHDPIYQGAKRDFADGGVPEPKLGLVTEATGGVLFIDEIGEMDPLLQNKLLKVLEDKRVFFDSSYYDADDPRVPEYVKRLFSQGAPADFVLIGATTREPDEISPAFRSRCAEVFFDALTPEHIVQIVRGAARRLKAKLSAKACGIIADHTIEARKAVSLLADAYAIALHNAGEYPERGFLAISVSDVKSAVESGRMEPSTSVKAKSTGEVGKVFGLGVLGYLGSIIEIETVTFPAHKRGKGTLRMNETAGSMVKDSLFNASSVLRKTFDIDLYNWDIHVNIIGGAKIQGPSAGLALTLAIFSAISGVPVRQDVAVTGEVSLTGYVKPVGGVYEKIYGAKQAGMKSIIIPYDNSPGLKEVGGIDVIYAKTLKEALDHTCPGWRKIYTCA